MKQTKAERIVDVVLDELLGRGGFDTWWYSIDREVQRQLRLDLAERVQRAAQK